MTAPGSLGHIAGRSPDWLIRKVAELEKKLDRLMTQRTLESALIGKGGLTVQGGSIVLKDAGGTVLQVMDADGITLSGDLVADGGTLRSANYVAGTSGWRLRPDGTVEINDAVIRGGIIGNDALTNPVQADTYFASTANYAVGTVAVGSEGSATVRASVTVTIPAGFTAVTMFATVQDGAINSTGSTDDLFSALNFGAPNADFTYSASADVPAGAAALAVATTTRQFTGLTGGDTVSVQSRPFTGIGTWSADPFNSTALSVMALFLR